VDDTIAPKTTALVSSHLESPQYLQAKDLFLTHASMADVSRATGISLKVIKRWKKENEWELEREDLTRGLIEDSFGARKVTIAKIIKTAPELLLKGLEYLAQRVDPLTLDEQVKVSTIIGNLDRISRLDSGKATDNIAISGTMQLTAQEIRKVILSDPFFASEPIDAEE
jgi:hypothetical protein